MAKPLPQPLETLKRFVDKAPDVKIVDTISRWLRAQPPADPTPQPEQRPLQSR